MIQCAYCEVKYHLDHLFNECPACGKINKVLVVMLRYGSRTEVDKAIVSIRVCSQSLRLTLEAMKEMSLRQFGVFLPINDHVRQLLGMGKRDCK